jgi:hypothetical protein
MMLIRGYCSRCDSEQDVYLILAKLTRPDHMHMTCLPCGRPTLLVRLREEHFKKSSAIRKRIEQHGVH